MSSILKRFAILALLLGITGCAVHPPPTVAPLRESPEIKVGLVEGLRQIEFTTQNRFRIVNSNGVQIAEGSSGSRWRVEVIQSIPGQAAYRLVAGSMSDRSGAREQARKVEALGLKTEIRVIGRPLMVGNQIVTTNRAFRIYLSDFYPTREAATAAKDSLLSVETFVTRQVIQRPEGLFQVTALETGESFKSTEPIQIEGSSITLHDFPVGNGFHWEHTEDQTYPEIIRFELDPDGNLAVINEVPLEVYVQGVIPSEMPPGFPLEALKAQAVAARGKVLGAWGVVHQDDPYDVCARVHCQVYSGLTKRDPRTDRAAHETAGLVMWSDGKLVDAIFGGVCGGHTEDVDLAWGGKAYDYLKGTFDGPNSLRDYGPLHIEENARRWIDDPPSAFCNTTLNPVPESLNYTKKYFRWEVRLTPDDVRAALSKRKLEVGEVLDLVPLERGVSGRIIRLKVVGSEGERIIQGELNIRQALSATTLWSSCFYVRKEEGVFVLKGAGWGHGVGMCQTGAAMMAASGKKFHQILKHYYRGVEIKRLY